MQENKVAFECQINLFFSARVVRAIRVKMTKKRRCVVEKVVLIKLKNIITNRTSFLTLFIMFLCLSPVALDLFFLQSADNIIFDIHQMKHTLISFPIFRVHR